jgi:ADP-L-glycero-D-manno-heptose 6-epimerase
MFVVTGANGFIGSQLVLHLNSLGHTDIVCVDPIDTHTRPKPLNRAKYQSFLKPEELFSFLDLNKTKVKSIFHLGACSDTQELDVHFLRKNNTEYTNLLFSFATQNPDIVFIYASSGAVYGQGELGFSDEIPSEKLHPLNPYGWSKVNSDIWIQEQSKKPKRWYGLRFFNVYGPNEDHKGNMRSVVHKAFEQIQRSGRLDLFKSKNVQYKDGRQMRDFIYVKDVVSWIWWIFENKNIRSDIYNMGYGRARSWLDLAEAVFSAMKKEIDINWIDMPKDLESRYQYFTEARMKKFLSQGATNPKWSLENGIEDYVCKHLMMEADI